MIYLSCYAIIVYIYFFFYKLSEIEFTSLIKIWRSSIKCQILQRAFKLAEMRGQLQTIKKEKRDLSLKKQRLLSFTDTNFKIKKVKVLLQKGIQEKPNDVHLNYSVRLNEKLSSIFQPNDSIRRQSAESLLDIARNYPKIIHENINRVLSTTSSCWVDNDLYVRRAIYLMTLELLKSKDSSIIVPFSEMIFMQIRGTLSHIRNEVRIDGLTFLNEYLSIDFGQHKGNFITLQYLLGWSPLVCRVAQSPNFYNTLDSLFTITITIRNITNQILKKLKNLNEYELSAISHSELSSSILKLYDSLVQVSFEIISKREQKMSDHISLSGMNSIQSRKKMKHEHFSSIRIKRSLIPNVPEFFSNDRDHILSVLSSIVLDTLYNINKFGTSFINDYKQMNKICNSIKEFHLELKDSYPFSQSDKSGFSIFFIEKLLLLRILSLPFFTFKGDYKNNIYEIIKYYFCILTYFKEKSNNENELLLDTNNSELFEFIFLEGVEMMYLSSLDRTSLRKFFTPNKYILFYLLSILLDVNDSLNQKNISEFDLNEIKNSGVQFDQILSTIPLDFSYKEGVLSAREVFQLLLSQIINNTANVTNENGQLTITALKIMLFLPLILRNVGYLQNYCVDKYFSIWSPIEHILVSTNERLNPNNISAPLKNDIVLAKYWISYIPKLVFFLYHNSIDEEKQYPISLICNLLFVLEDYIFNRISPQLEDNSLLIDVCRGIMPLFINTRQKTSQNNVITILPFHYQKSIISTIPFWPNLPKKFISSIIDQVLIFAKSESNLHYSFFMIKTLITEQNDSSLPLEVKMSIIVTIINGCNCKISTKFQLFNLLSEFFIDLSKTYILSSQNQEENYFHKVFFKNWFIPLINNLNSCSNSEIKWTNISLIFNCIISKVTKIRCFATPKFVNYKFINMDNYPKYIKEQICNYVAFTPGFEVNYFFLEEQNITLIYSTIISNVITPTLSLSNIEQMIPLKSLKFPILTIIYIWKGYLYFDHHENTTELEKNKLCILSSVVVYIFETYLSGDKQHLRGECLERLFTFSIISISWILSMSDYNFYATMNISQVVEKAEHFFKEIKNESYLTICKAIKKVALQTN